MGLKPLLSAILAFTNADNKRLNNAVEILAGAGFGRRVLREIPHLPLHLGLCAGKRTGGASSAPATCRGAFQGCSGLGNNGCFRGRGRSVAWFHRDLARPDALQSGPGHGRAAPGRHRHVAAALGFAVERRKPSVPHAGRQNHAVRANSSEQAAWIDARASRRWAGGSRFSSTP